MTDRLTRAHERFDAMNEEDPHLEVVNGAEVPKELVYGRRMSSRQERFAPDAPETVKLAVRAQHLRRQEARPRRRRRGQAARLGHRDRHRDVVRRDEARQLHRGREQLLDEAQRVDLAPAPASAAIILAIMRWNCWSMARCWR